MCVRFARECDKGRNPVRERGERGAERAMVGEAHMAMAGHLVGDETAAVLRCQ